MKLSYRCTTKRIYIIGFILFFIFVSAYIFCNNPNEANSHTPECLIHKFTGLYCPGCGITRAWYAILHLDFKEAYSQNTLAFFFTPILILTILYPKISHTRWYFIFIFTSAYLFAFLRNIEYFNFLAPH